MTDVAFLSAIELAGIIQSKQISSVELTRLYIDRIERYDGAINAVVVRIFEEALAAAETTDTRLAKGDSLGPLHGVPMTIKESYVIKGTPSSWGLEAFRNNVAKADGLAVRRFKAAGAHFLGKTNVPVELADFQSYNPVYGTTGNPWNTELTPGGSSGGSAAALAAGFSGLEAGSDIGGSIRNPAHFCGVYGHKPTYGVIPMQGHELVEGVPEADLAVCGPLARSAEDLHLALDIMAGPADREAMGWQLKLPPADFTELKDLRVAIWGNDEMAPVSKEIADRADQVGRILSDMGAAVSSTARPDFTGIENNLNYRTLLNSVMSANLPADQVKKIQARVDALDPEDFSEDAVSARSAVLSHRDWIRTNFSREKLRNAWRLFFEDWDIVICPQMATAAFPHDHSSFEGRTITVDNLDQPYFTQLFWSGLVTNSYLPSTVFPTGLSKTGLPIGLQAISAPYRDHRTIEFARQITQQMGGFVAPAAYP